MGIRVDRQAAGDGRAGWFQPSRLLTAADEGERHATWLELFFDLVFVVAITELSHQLVVDHSAGAFLRFAALFVPVYVSLIGTRTVTVHRSHRLGASLKLAGAAIILGLIGEESVLPPVAVAAALARVLAAVVFVEHTRLSSSV
jgi:hypothetical protein